MAKLDENYLEIIRHSLYSNGGTSKNINYDSHKPQKTSKHHQTDSKISDDGQVRKEPKATNVAVFDMNNGNEECHIFKPCKSRISTPYKLEGSVSTKTVPIAAVKVSPSLCPKSKSKIETKKRALSDSQSPKVTFKRKKERHAKNGIKLNFEDNNLTTNKINEYEKKVSKSEKKKKTEIKKLKETVSVICNPSSENTATQNGLELSRSGFSDESILSSPKSTDCYVGNKTKPDGKITSKGIDKGDKSKLKTSFVQTRKNSKSKKALKHKKTESKQGILYESFDTLESDFSYLYNKDPCENHKENTHPTVENTTETSVAEAAELKSTKALKQSKRKKHRKDIQVTASDIFTALIYKDSSEIEGEIILVKAEEAKNSESAKTEKKPKKKKHKNDIPISSLQISEQNFSTLKDKYHSGTSLASCEKSTEIRIDEAVRYFESTKSLHSKKKKHKRNISNSLDTFEPNFSSLNNEDLSENTEKPIVENSYDINVSDTTDLQSTKTLKKSKKKKQKNDIQVRALNTLGPTISSSKEDNFSATRGEITVATITAETSKNLEPTKIQKHSKRKKNKNVNSAISLALSEQNFSSLNYEERSEKILAVSENGADDRVAEVAKDQQLKKALKHPEQKNKHESKITYTSLNTFETNFPPSWNDSDCDPNESSAIKDCLKPKKHSNKEKVSKDAADFYDDDKVAVKGLKFQKFCNLFPPTHHEQLQKSGGTFSIPSRHLKVTKSDIYEWRIEGNNSLALGDIEQDRGKSPRKNWYSEYMKTQMRSANKQNQSKVKSPPKTGSHEIMPVQDSTDSDEELNPDTRSYQAETLLFNENGQNKNSCDSECDPIVQKISPKRSRPGQLSKKHAELVTLASISMKMKGISVQHSKDSEEVPRHLTTSYQTETLLHDDNRQNNPTVHEISPKQSMPDPLVREHPDAEIVSSASNLVETSSHIPDSSVKHVSEVLTEGFADISISSKKSHGSLAGNSDSNSTSDFEKEHISTPPTIITLKDSSKIVLLQQPDERIHFHGLCLLEVLHGGVEILGARLNRNSKHQKVYSPRGTSLLYIENVRKLHASNSLELKGLISEDLLTKNQLNICLEQHSAILLCKQLKEPYIEFIENHISQIIFPENTNFGPRVDFVLTNRWNKMKVSQIWEDVVENISQESKAVICGGKGVGKSTFLRYAVNMLLRKYKKIRVVDFDPGQPEFYPPGYIYITTVEKEVFGPNYTHLQSADRLVLSHINIGYNVKQYLKSVKYLLESLEVMETLPTLVNFPGFTQGIGLDIATNALQLLKPTLVIEIKSKTFSKNYKVDMKAEHVNKLVKLKKILKSKDISDENTLNYNFVKFDSLSEKNEAWSLEARQARELCILAYFGKMMSENVRDLTSPAVSMFSIQISALTITNIEGRIISPLAVNGSLVALCSIEHRNSDTYIGHGYGFVRGMNLETDTLVLLTPEPVEVLENVSHLVLSSVTTPPSLVMSATDVKGHIPYVNVGELIDFGQFTKRPYLPPKKQ